MKKSVIGYPRVGSKRELKFALEKYFRGEIPIEELIKTSKELRTYSWLVQKKAGIDFISSNDFSFYDNMLDTSFMLGVIPERYKKLCLSKPDTYFAMARGYQSKNGDLTALPMKKWFNTNYHYIVPEFDDKVEIRLDDSKIVEEYKEALSCGVQTKPVVIGPYTFLKLSRFSGKKQLVDFAKEISAAYRNLLKNVACLGAKWIQIDEPALVLDMTDEDKKLFKTMYNDVLEEKPIKILLQTYFGDVRDFFDELVNFDFDGIGLDFVEGKETFELIKKHNEIKKQSGTCLLFAGIVNGKNIWRNNYEKTSILLEEIEKYWKGEIVLSTSCSLLHVPYSVKNEEKLDSTILEHFAFAEEKLIELSEIAAKDKNTLEKNKKLFNKQRILEDSLLKEKINNLSKNDFTRLPPFAEREVAQKKSLNYHCFQLQRSVLFRKQKKFALTVQILKKELFQKNNTYILTAKKLQNVLHCKKKLDLMYLYMANMSATTW